MGKLAFTVSIFVLLSQGVRADISEYGVEAPNLDRRIQKITDVTEKGRYFAAVVGIEKLRSREGKLYIAKQRADRICKKYGYDGLNLASKTPFRTADAIEDQWSLLVVNDKNQIVEAQEFKNDVKAPGSHHDNLAILGKSAGWFVTLGAFNDEAQKFTYLECQKTLPIN